MLEITTTGGTILTGHSIRNFRPTAPYLIQYDFKYHLPIVFTLRPESDIQKTVSKDSYKYTSCLDNALLGYPLIIRRKYIGRQISMKQLCTNINSVWRSIQTCLTGFSSASIFCTMTAWQPWEVPYHRNDRQVSLT